METPPTESTNKPTETAIPFVGPSRPSLSGMVSETKRKRGRPKGSKGKTSTPYDNENPQVVNTPGMPSVDPVIIKKSVEAVVATIDSVVVNRVVRTATIASGDEKYAVQMGQEAGLRESELDSIGDLAARICVKRQLLGQFAEEIMLAGLLGSWGIRVTLVMRKLTALEAAILKERSGNKESQ